MSGDIFGLTCSALNTAQLVGFQGREQISQPYEFELYFTVPLGTDAKSAVGARASLTVNRDEDPLAWHGIIVGVRMVHQVAERVLYRALLVPRLWLLRHSWRSNVFTGRSIKDFLTDTLTDGGLTENEFRFDIDDGKYRKEEFVAQYRETHLDFFHRWLEREGLYYYFEHEAVDNGNEVLVIVDDRRSHEPFPGGGRARYYPLTGDDSSAREALTDLQCDYNWLPASVTIADFNYNNPSASVIGEKPVTTNGLGKIREYGYRVFDANEAARLAEVRAQSIGCREVTLRAHGSVFGLRTGYELAIDDKPSEIAESWLAIEVRHCGSLSAASAAVRQLIGIDGDQTYRVEVRAIPSEQQYRRPQDTPWPRIYGFENAIVDGAADSPYAQLDEHGRYLVRFEFDDSDLIDGQASTWVRMLQPHGGGVEGWHFPLRKNTEVMVGFLGGDPDRPFIAGVVPNSHTPSPVSSNNHTFNIILTGGNNQIDLEDLEGKQHIHVHTPTHATRLWMGGPGTYAFSEPGDANPNADAMHITANDYSFYVGTEGNAGLSVGGFYWENIGSFKKVFVGDFVHLGYASHHKLEIGGNSDEFYYAFRNTVTTSGRTDKVLGGGMEQEITGGLTQTVHTGGKQTVNGGWTHKVTGTNHDDYGVWTTDVGGTWTATVNADIMIESSTGAITIKSPTEIQLNAPTVTIKGKEIKTKSTSFFKYAQSKHEFYVYKGASGIFKSDHSGLYQAFCGMKLDTTLMKVENKPMYKENWGVAMKDGGALLRSAGAALANVGAKIRNAGFSKI